MEPERYVWEQSSAVVAEIMLSTQSSTEASASACHTNPDESRPPPVPVVNNASFVGSLKALHSNMKDLG